MPEQKIAYQECRRCGEVFEKDEPETVGACDYCQWSDWHEETSAQ